MKSSILFPFHAVVLSAFLLCQLIDAAPLIEVRDVQLDSVGSEKWGRTRVIFRVVDGLQNSLFIDDIQARILLAIGSQRKGFESYSASVDIVALQKGEAYCLDFFLPAVVFERNRFEYRLYAYLIEWKIGGGKQAFHSKCASKNLSHSENAIQYLVDEVDAGSETNRGVLLPSYLAPYPLNFEFSSNYPAFKRMPPSS